MLGYRNKVQLKWIKYTPHPLAKAKTGVSHLSTSPCHSHTHTRTVPVYPNQSQMQSYPHSVNSSSYYSPHPFNDTLDGTFQGNKRATFFPGDLFLECPGSMRQESQGKVTCHSIICSVPVHSLTQFITPGVWPISRLYLLRKNYPRNVFTVIVSVLYASEMVTKDLHYISFFVCPSPQYLRRHKQGTNMQVGLPWLLLLSEAVGLQCRYHPALHIWASLILFHHCKAWWSNCFPNYHIITTSSR